MDAALGMIEELERALAGEDLAMVARLQEGLRARPLPVPEDLLARWQELQGRAAAGLACAPRLRELLSEGRILAARAILAPLRGPAAPAWVRDGLDRSAEKIGWPAIGRAYSVGPVGEVGDLALGKHRQVRFVQDGVIRDARVSATVGRRLTLRVAGAAGYLFPVLDPGDVEPVTLKPGEALQLGLAAAAAQDVVSLLLWSCYLHEAGAKSASERLRSLLR